MDSINSNCESTQNTQIYEEASVFSIEIGSDGFLSDNIDDDQSISSEDVQDAFLYEGATSESSVNENNVDPFQNQSGENSSSQAFGQEMYHNYDVDQILSNPSEVESEDSSEGSVGDSLENNGSLQLNGEDVTLHFLLGKDFHEELKSFMDDSSLIILSDEDITNNLSEPSSLIESCNEDMEKDFLMALHDDPDFQKLTFKRY